MAEAPMEHAEEAPGDETPAGKSFDLRNRVPNLVGRMEVCEEITKILTSDDTRLVTLVAPPGFGKTAVAIDVSYMMLEKGKDVLYLCLREVKSVVHAAEKLLKTIGMPVGNDPVVFQVERDLASLEKETVLVLDNAEGLQIGEESAAFNHFLEKIGQHAKNVVILIASRNPFSELDFPFLRIKQIPLKPLRDEPSFLFLKNDAPSIPDQLARRFAKPEVCGGVPLVLELTASFLARGTVNPEELLRQLQNCPHSLLEARYLEVRERFEVFYNHLPPEVKKALSSLAAFPTVFTKQEARNVLFRDDNYSDFERLLDDLDSYSLLQQDIVDECLQYSLHPLVQAFCIESRENSREGYNMAIRLFSRYYLKLLQQLNDDFITTNCKDAIDMYRLNKANICHALLTSTKEDENLKLEGLKVSTETVNFLAKVMNMEEFMSFYKEFLKKAEELPDETLYSECLVSIGFKQLCYYGCNDAYRTEAKINLERAHDLQNRLGITDTECQGHCKCKLGLCTFIAGDKKKGISLIAQGIGVRKRLVSSHGSGKMERMLLAGGFSDLAMAMLNSGQYKAAACIWEKICLDIYNELLGTHPFTASLLDYLGQAYQKRGDHKRAVEFKDRCLTMRLFLLGENHLDTARAYYGLGCALFSSGENHLDTARAYYGLGCALQELHSHTETATNRERAICYLNKALTIQVRFHASEHDITKTRQELATKDLQGRLPQLPIKSL